MTKQEATAEVFWQAIRGLPAKGRERLIRRMLQDKTFRQDLIDLALIESRRGEPARDFRDYLADSRRSN